MITTLHNFIAVMQCYAVLRDAIDTLLHKVPTRIRIEKANKKQSQQSSSCQSKAVGKPGKPGKLESLESWKAQSFQENTASN